MTSRTHPLYSFALATGAFFAAATGAVADGPVAIVEEVDSRVADVDFLAYLTIGRVIHLSPTDRLVIGYLNSCWRETIVGGDVTVGSERSEVKGGAVERVKVRCDPGKSSASKQTERSGAMVFRRKVTHQTIYSQTPVFEIHNAHYLLIKRLDAPEKSIRIVIEAAQLLQRSFLDLAKNNVSLTRGGLYLASTDGAESIFRVNPSAEAEPSTIIARLVRVRPSP